jgi:ribosomal 50S subunit-recycling heat shock protein
VKDYQVTGPVLEVKDDMIVVQKGDEKWEIAKDKDTKVTGDVKVGSKVTIKYKMKATAVEVKADEAKKETKKEATKEPKKK